MPNRLLLPLLFLAVACSTVNSNADDLAPVSGGVSAVEMNRNMKAGFNLGNTFDSHQNSTEFEDIKPLIDLYHTAGARHVRIPVTWVGTIANREGQINKEHVRFKQLQQVVDYALSKDLVVIINTHHEHWLKEHYDGSAAFDNAFSNLWKGIATHFNSYSSKLIFEVLNEPEKAFGDWSGPIRPTDSIAVERTRHINELGWRTIRETAGANRSRIVMMGTNGQGNHSTFKSVYPTSDTLPGGGQDRYLIVTVHTYDPWKFCGQDGRNQYAPSSETIRASIGKVSNHARELGVSVNYGEFGVGRNENPSERDSDVVRSYYRTLATTAIAEGMSVTPWDDRGWFGLTTRSKDGSFRFLYNIVPTMMDR